MLTGRVREWLDAFPASFERGEVHEENLGYLLGSAFVPQQGWEQGVAVFEEIVDAVSAWRERLITRLIVPLTDAECLVTGPYQPKRSRRSCT